MKAVVVERFGGPEVMVVRDRPRPRPGPHDVCVHVRACGVCRHDALTRAGAFPKIALPIILGHQIAGVVESIGAEVTGLRPGQRVMSMVYETCGRCEMCRIGAETHCRSRPKFLGEDIDGGYAETVVANERVWLPLPQELSFETGAVLTCTLGTAFHAIVSRGKARQGETAVVTGAGGGVGWHALQILRAGNVRTIAVTSRSDKSAALREAGADEVVVARDGRFAQDVKALTGGLGADLALEIVGGPGIRETTHALRPLGRMIVLGNVAGKTVDLPPAYLILKEISLIGTKSIGRQEMMTLLSLVARGKLAPQVAQTMPLEGAAEAHRRMELGENVGRTVLIP